MPLVPIESLDDPRIATYRHLKRTNDTRDNDLFVVEGEKLLERLVESRFPLASVLSTERYASRTSGRIPPEIPHYVVSEALISVIVGFNFHRGVLACGHRRPDPELADIATAAERSTLIVCPTLNNPENLGTIIRIGDVFGVDAVLVGGSCPDPLSRRVLRVSMGTSLHLPVIVRDDLAADVDRLKTDWGFELLATVLDPDAEPFESVHRANRLALFMGSESEGLDPEWINRCQRRVTIPMRAGAESLNVAVATGIFLYHFSKP